MKVTKKDEVEETMSQFIIGRQNVTDDNVKYLFRKTNNYFKETSSNYTSADDLWTYIIKQKK